MAQESKKYLGGQVTFEEGMQGAEDLFSRITNPKNLTSPEIFQREVARAVEELTRLFRDMLSECRTQSEADRLGERALKIAGPNLGDNCDECKYKAVCKRTCEMVADRIQTILFSPFTGDKVHTPFSDGFGIPSGGITVIQGDGFTMMTRNGGDLLNLSGTFPSGRGIPDGLQAALEMMSGRLRSPLSLRDVLGLGEEAILGEDPVFLDERPSTIATLSPDLFKDKRPGTIVLQGTIAIAPGEDAETTGDETILVTGDGIAFRNNELFGRFRPGTEVVVIKTKKGLKVEVL